MDDDSDKDLVAVAARLREHLADERGKIRVADALCLAGFDRPTFYRTQLVGRAMRELGWDRARFRLDGKLHYAYARGTRLEREVFLDVERGVDDRLVVKRRGP